MKNAGKIIGGVLLFLTMLFWGFFANASGISIQTILGLNGFSKIIDALLNINFLLFIVFFPLTIALVCCYTRIFERKTLYIQVVSSFVLFGLAGLIFFSSLADLWLVGLAYIISLFLVIEMSFVKFQELRSLHFLRASAAAVSQVNLLLGIAFFVFTAFFVVSSEENIAQTLEQKALAAVVNKDMTEGLSQTTTKVFVEGQKQILATIIATPQFEALRTKTDPDVLVFVTTANEAFDQLNSPQYFDVVEKQFSEGASQAVNLENIMEAFNKVKNDIPAIKFFEDFFWLFAGLIVSSFYLFLGSIAFKPLGAVYGFLIGLFAQNLEKPNPQ